MLLFQKRFLDGLVRGDIDLTFQTWTKPLVKPGRRYRCHPIGVLEVDGIQQRTVESITAREARRAGFADREDLVDYLSRGGAVEIGPDSNVFRVELHYAGDGDRVPAAVMDRLTEADVESIRKRLERMDARAGEPWTMATLRLIGKMPRVAARVLAEKLGREKLPFKADVVKLKKLGLTQSFEVGYELSPRGKAWLAAVRRGRTKSRRVGPAERAR